MEENLKQRLVGAGVLAALAVIFLPALFDKNEPVKIDTTSQIPTPPKIKPVTIDLPTKPEGVKLPPSGEDLFKPKFTVPKEEPSKEKSKSVAEIQKNQGEKISAESSDSISSDDDKVIEPIPKANKPKVSKPSLTESGVPKGWVIQAASFRSEESAKKFTTQLKKGGFKAYSQAVKTSKGEFYRVLVGPYIDESKANKAKGLIDKAHTVESKVLRFNPISGN